MQGRRELLETRPSGTERAAPAADVKELPGGFGHTQWRSGPHFLKTVITHKCQSNGGEMFTPPSPPNPRTLPTLHQTPFMIPPAWFCLLLDKEHATRTRTQRHN